MPFAKGHSGNPSGRKKGKPNKLTANMREAFQDAFDQMGGVGRLVKWAGKNPTEFYKLASKLIPIELSGKIETDNRVHITREVIHQVPDPDKSEDV